LAAAGRHYVTIGGLAGRGATTSRRLDAGRVRDVTAVWRHAWTWFALVAWVPEDGQPASARSLAALHAAFTHGPEPSRRLAQTVEAVSRELPLLSPASAELIVRSRPQAWPVEQAARDAFRLAALGVGSLRAEEATELATLDAEAQAELPARDGTRLAAYLDRLRTDLPTAPEEDREFLRLLKQGLLQLPSPRLVRLQDLYAKAIAAGVRGQSSARRPAPKAGAGGA
jgi:hypothetical protein